MAKLSDLSKGDIFLFDAKFGELHRLHSISKRKNGSFNIYFICVNYAGDIGNAAAISFTWRDSDIQVCIIDSEGNFELLDNRTPVSSIGVNIEEYLI